MNILVTGATGFVGTALVEGLVSASHGVRGLVRRMDSPRARRLAGLGVELVEGDVTDGESLRRAAASGVDAVVHLVGILAETREASFEAVHVEGTSNVVEACRAAGVRRFLHMSSLGTRAGGRSLYHRSKWRAEQIVREAGLDYTIFRPSVIFGPGDSFTNIFARILRIVPVAALPGDGKNLMQPVHIDDVTAALVRSFAMEETVGAVLELGGPERLSFDEIIDAVAAALGRRAVKLHIPTALMRPVAALAERLLPAPPLTRDQLLMLDEDNVTDHNALEEVFGMEPRRLADGLKSYLR